MGNLIDLTGQKFGRWTVLSQAPSDKHSAMWNCVCACGTKRVVKSPSLRRGRSKSCGCLKNELLAIQKPSKIHGKSGTAIHRTWKAMKVRCYNKNFIEYKNYGGRGITVCSRWLNSFEDFYKDMGDVPVKKSIDRINNDGNYEPDNCKWSTPKEQSRNTGVNRNITYKGKTQCLSAWSEELEIPCTTLFNRLNNHSPEIAFIR